MDTLILIKHTLPEIVKDLPPVKWRLSGEGRRRCALLAERLSGYHPMEIYSSHEPKAVETAMLLARAWSALFEIRDGFQEHDRSVPRFLSDEEFDQTIQSVFREPDTPCVLGTETGNQAYARFDAAIHRLVEDAKEQTAIVVTHGTVLSLFVSRYNLIDPYPLWCQLDLPSFVVLSVPTFRIVEVVPHMLG